MERKHTHILNVACALSFQANLSIKFSGECVLTAPYLINRTHSLLMEKLLLKYSIINLPLIHIFTLLGTYLLFMIVPCLKIDFVLVVKMCFFGIHFREERLEIL